MHLYLKILILFGDVECWCLKKEMTWVWAKVLCNLVVFSINVLLHIYNLWNFWCMAFECYFQWNNLKTVHFPFAFNGIERQFKFLTSYSVLASKHFIEIWDFIASSVFDWYDCKFE